MGVEGSATAMIANGCGRQQPLDDFDLLLPPPRKYRPHDRGPNRHAGANRPGYPNQPHSITTGCRAVGLKQVTLDIPVRPPIALVVSIRRPARRNCRCAARS